MPDFDFLSAVWILTLSVAFFAGFIRGVTGFAQNLVLVPILLLFLDAKSVVVISLLLSVIASIALLPWTWRSFDLKKILPLAAASLLGIPLGAYIIRIISPSTLKVFIGWLVIIFAVPLAFGITFRFRRERFVSGISGFISGFLSSSTSLGGPPVVLFMHSQNWPKSAIYSTLNIYFLFLSASSLGFLTIFLENMAG